MDVRGGYGRENILRQKPQARTVFQAGDSTRSIPEGVDKDSKKGLESREEVVGVLKYTTRIPLGHDWPLCRLKCH